jgi:hypothetical protein
VSEARELLFRLAAAQLGDWTGLPAGLTIADVGAVLALDDEVRGSGLLGEDRQSAEWVAAESALYDGGVRVWHDGGDVLLVEAHHPLVDGAPVAAPSLGEPDVALNATLGHLNLEGGELVYASRGLSLRVNPVNGVLLAVLAFAPTTAEDYRARLRPDQPRARRRPLSGGSLR